MSNSPPSLGTPARLLAEEMVLRAVLDVLERMHPAAKQLVFDRAHERLSQAGPQVSHEHEFFHQAHAAIDAVMQVPTAAEVAAQAAERARSQVIAKVVPSPEHSPDRGEHDEQSAA